MKRRGVFRLLAGGLVLAAVTGLQGAEADGSPEVPGGARSLAFRESRFRLELDTASADRVRERVQAILGSPRSVAAAREYLAGIELLARREGAAAITFARENPFAPLPPRGVWEAAIRGWSALDPDAVEKWLRENPEQIAEDDQAELIRLLLHADALPDGKRALPRARRLAGEGD